MEDHPLEPGEDATTFFQPRALVFVTMLWVIALVWLLVTVLYGAVVYVTGIELKSGDILIMVESVLIVPTVTAGLIMLITWQRLGWLKSSVYGLEFAATGRRGVHLQWSSIASVGLRRWGPFTELVVTPTDMAAVTELRERGRAPRVLRRDAGSAFLIDVGLMSPGPRTLIAELHRRIPSRV
ncbi:hypothetical protein ACFQFC_39730 [Amorphoplanes digitatis]|uniref:PH domain-containing protein n=1 Tax=Actinoplanes digitatis TaxID=1868 RepID=A0A7W7MQ80_9ACTN|nr:hypothetical protein [Actinoplanes digitatis]MBB4762305.1 hypothetical protein [Actinoplanes digitatis]GID92573.1 hypothetical protein Adi01nite_19850 [Actinoplanes digitatis]